MTSSKWTKDELIAEARRRTSALPEQTKDAIEHMLSNLAEEAHWKAEELVDALCTDVIRRSTRPPPRRSGTMVKVQLKNDDRRSAANSRRK